MPQVLFGGSYTANTLRLWDISPYRFAPDWLFFLNKFIYFNWRLITLQYCSGFTIH